VKVLDFGVAKVMTKLAAVAPSAFPTAEGSIVGTPRFCSPEQARGEKVDLRCDIYSTGLLLVYLTTGRGPYPEKKNMAEMLLAHAYDVAVPPSSLEPLLDVAFDEVVLKALAKQPSDRYADAASFMAALEGLRSEPVAPVPAATESVAVAMTTGEGDATEPDAKSPAWVAEPAPTRHVASAADDPTVVPRAGTEAFARATDALASIKVEPERRDAPKAARASAPARPPESDPAVAWVASGAADVRDTVRLELPVIADQTFSAPRLAAPVRPRASPSWMLVIGALALVAIAVLVVLLLGR